MDRMNSYVLVVAVAIAFLASAAGVDVNADCSVWNRPSALTKYKTLNTNENLYRLCSVVNTNDETLVALLAELTADMAEACQNEVSAAYLSELQEFCKEAEDSSARRLAGCPDGNCTIETFATCTGAGGSVDVNSCMDAFGAGNCDSPTAFQAPFYFGVADSEAFYNITIGCCTEVAVSVTNVSQDSVCSLSGIPAQFRLDETLQLYIPAESGQELNVELHSTSGATEVQMAAEITAPIQNLEQVMEYKFTVEDRYTTAYVQREGSAEVGLTAASFVISEAFQESQEEVDSFLRVVQSMSVSDLVASGSAFLNQKIDVDSGVSFGIATPFNESAVGAQRSVSCDSQVESTVHSVVGVSGIESVLECSFADLVETTAKVTFEGVSSSYFGVDFQTADVIYQENRRRLDTEIYTGETCFGHLACIVLPVVTINYSSWYTFEVVGSAINDDFSEKGMQEFLRSAEDAEDVLYTTTLKQPNTILATNTPTTSTQTITTKVTVDPPAVLAFDLYYIGESANNPPIRRQLEEVNPNNLGLRSRTTVITLIKSVSDTTSLVTPAIEEETYGYSDGILVSIEAESENCALRVDTNFSADAALLAGVFEQKKNISLDDVELREVTSTVSKMYVEDRTLSYCSAAGLFFVFINGELDVGFSPSVINLNETSEPIDLTVDFTRSFAQPEDESFIEVKMDEANQGVVFSTPIHEGENLFNVTYEVQGDETLYGTVEYNSSNISSCSEDPFEFTPGGNPYDSEVDRHTFDSSFQLCFDTAKKGDHVKLSTVLGETCPRLNLTFQRQDDGTTTTVGGPSSIVVNKIGDLVKIETDRVPDQTWKLSYYYHTCEDEEYTGFDEVFDDPTTVVNVTVTTTDPFTVSPTSSPTTGTPSTSPTAGPTPETASPTSAPSSSTQTMGPTSWPTFTPTKWPTYSPTTTPPTKSPTVGGGGWVRGLRSKHR